MNGVIRTSLVTALCLVLAACNTPRGAGFQSEVLAASAQDGTAAPGEPGYDFDVVQVTRASLPVIADWPVHGAAPHNWPGAQAQPANVLIAPGDLLRISVWDAEENSLLTSPGQRVTQLQDVRVGADGRIFIPFVGEMRVAGMAPGTARARIEQELIATVPSAQVQLDLEAGRGNTVELVSGISRPGVYPMADSDTSVLEMIAEAGGVASGIANPRIKLFRGGTTYTTSVARLFESPALDATVIGGDRIIVEEETRRFISLGAANRQQIHVFPEDRVTALEALAMIGGVDANRANPQGVLVLRDYPAGAVSDGIRGPSMERMVFTIDLTTADGLFSAGQFQIRDGDLVYATESPLGTARTIVGLVASGLSLLNDLDV